MVMRPDERPPVKVLIVDDQPSIRLLLRHKLEMDPTIRVVAEAGDAKAAREAINAFRPDVITLDVEMPGMDGLEFLKRLMQARPTPVVMISSQTKRGSEAAIRALSLGAVYCLDKNGALGDEQAQNGSLVKAVRIAAIAKVGLVKPRLSRHRPDVHEFTDWNRKFIAIGSSTGGVEALEHVLGAMPHNCPPIVITQHMPAPFLKNFALRLDSVIPPSVKLAEDGMPLRQGEVLLAPGGEFHLHLATGPELVARLEMGPKRSGHRPSVDEMFCSALPDADRCVAVLLTGMGRDGAEGMLALRRAGAYCIAQDQESSVVYGMPRVAAEIGAVDAQLPLKQIGDHILDLCGQIKSARVLHD